MITFVVAFATTSIALAQSASVIDRGHLEYRLRGQPIGSEDFVVELVPGPAGAERMSWRSTSTITIGERTIVMHVQAVYELRDGRPSSLAVLRERIDAGIVLDIEGELVDRGELKVIIPAASTERLRQEAEARGERLIMDTSSITVAMQDEHRLPMKGVFLFDANGGYSTYAAAAASLAADATQSVERIAVIPSIARAETTPVTRLTIRPRGAQGTSRLVELDAGEQVVTVRLGAGRLRLEHIDLPAQSFAVVRTGDVPQGTPGHFSDLEAAVEESIEARPGVDEEVVIEVAGAKLAGALRRPESSPLDSPLGPPAVLLLSDAGPHDRDGNDAQTRAGLLAACADLLAQAGVASLRVDDRGAGASTGKLSELDLDARLADAEAAFRFLMRSPRIDTSRLAVLGHGEGALFALALVSQKRLPVDALALVACPSSAYPEVYTERAMLALARTGVEGAALEAALGPRRRLLDTLRRARTWGDVILLEPQAEDGRLARDLETWRAEAPLAYWQQHLDLEPPIALLVANVPILFAAGGKDTDVPPASASALQRILAQAGRRDPEVMILPHLDHELRYGATTTSDRESVKRVTAWLIERLR